MEGTEAKCHFYLKKHSNIYFAWCKTSVKILKLLNGNLFQPVQNLPIVNLLSKNVIKRLLLGSKGLWNQYTLKFILFGSINKFMTISIN